MEEVLSNQHVMVRTHRNATKASLCQAGVDSRVGSSSGISLTDTPSGHLDVRPDAGNSESSIKSANINRVAGRLDRHLSTVFNSNTRAPGTGPCEAIASREVIPSVVILPGTPA